MIVVRYNISSMVRIIATVTLGILKIFLGSFYSYKGKKALGVRVKDVIRIDYSNFSHAENC